MAIKIWTKWLCWRNVRTVSIPHSDTLSAVWSAAHVSHALEDLGFCDLRSHVPSPVCLGNALGNYSLASDLGIHNKLHTYQGSNIVICRPVASTVQLLPPACESPDLQKALSWRAREWQAKGCGFLFVSIQHLDLLGSCCLRLLPAFLSSFSDSSLFKTCPYHDSCSLAFFFF